MTRAIKVVLAFLFLTGVLVTGALGTETRLLFFWPGCALLGAAGVLAGLRWTWRMRSVPSDVCLAAALLFWAYFLTRQLTSPTTVWWREDFFILLACGVAYLLSATVLSHPRWRVGLAVTLLVVLAGNVVIGFIHFSGRWRFHIVPGYMRSFGEGDDQRIGGFFNNPNHLGAFFSLMALLSLGMACFGRGRNPGLRPLFFLGALAAAVGVAQTGSRGAMLGLAAGAVALTAMMLMLLRWARPHLLVRAAVALVVTWAVAVVILGAVMHERLGRIFAGGLPQGDPREFIWRSALAQHAEHPWFGAGARMFYEGCMRLRPDDAPAWMKDAMFAHNEWLQTLADYGWTGLLLIMLVFALHLVNGGAYLRRFALEEFPRTGILGGTRLGMTVGAMAALTAELVHAVFEFQFHVPAIAVSVAALMGVLANPGGGSRLWTPRRVWGARFFGKLALLASSVVLLWGTWIIGRADVLVERAKLAARATGANHPDIALLDRALKLDPANASTWHERGLAQIDESAGKPVAIGGPLLLAAAADLQEASRRNPYDFFPLLALADVDDALGRFEEAQRCLKEAHHLAPMFEAPRLALAIHWFRLQQWQRAEEAFLWARDARAGRTSDAWFDQYRQMLHVAMTSR